MHAIITLCNITTCLHVILRLLRLRATTRTFEYLLISMWVLYTQEDQLKYGLVDGILPVL